MIKATLLLFTIMLASCQYRAEKVKPVVASISESVYASGTIKSKDQYQAFATVSGVVEKRFVTEGDEVKKGAPILSIARETQKLNKENAELTARFSDVDANRDKLREAKLMIDVAKNKMINDSVLLVRQRTMWQQQIGTKVQLEERELAAQNSKAAWYSAFVKYNDLKRQLNFTAAQSQKNLQITQQQESDFIVRSEMDGVVYNLYKEKGEIVGPQTALALIGSSHKFLLEMQVDEYDIVKIKTRLPVLVTMDSYKGKVFEARVTKIYPSMNERSKTFLVEAEFIQPPDKLYPNTTLEANIILRTKQKALLIPRTYLLNDSVVEKSNGDKVIIKTGLSDYQQVEVISGITANDELIKPKP